MRYLIPLVAAAFLAAPVLAGADADREPTQAMAKILADFNHFPSDKDRDKLNAILADPDTGDHERVVAQAILNVEHRVTGEDRQRLQSVIEADDASDEVRTLAEVLVNMDHTPSDADKQRLRAISD